MPHQTRYYAGTSEATEAEIGYAAEEAFTLVQFYDGDYLDHEGFKTLAAMKIAIAEVRAEGAKVEWL